MEALLAKPYAALSNKGKKKFIHQGTMYTKHRDLKGANEGKVSAECDQRAIGCNGRAWLSKEGQFIKLVTNHECESNPSHVAVTAIRNEEKHLATTTTMQTGQILAQARNQTRTSGVQDAMPQVKARKKGIRRARTDSKDCKPPPVPTSLESIIIPQTYRFYDAIHGREPDEWLLADLGGRLLS